MKDKMINTCRFRATQVLKLNGTTNPTTTPNTTSSGSNAAASRTTKKPGAKRKFQDFESNEPDEEYSPRGTAKTWKPGRWSKSMFDDEEGKEVWLVFDGEDENSDESHKAASRISTPPARSLKKRHSEQRSSKKHSKVNLKSKSKDSDANEDHSELGDEEEDQAHENGVGTHERFDASRSAPRAHRTGPRIWHTKRTQAEAEAWKGHGCSACVMEFTSYEEAQRHAEEANNSTPFECPACDFRACVKETLAEHLKYCVNLEEWMEENHYSWPRDEYTSFIDRHAAFKQHDDIAKGYRSFLAHQNEKPAAYRKRKAAEATAAPKRVFARPIGSRRLEFRKATS